MVTRDVGGLKRGERSLATLGLTLAESKALLKDIQTALVECPLHAYLDALRPLCHQPRRAKGYHHSTFRTVFGTIAVASPRLYHGGCQPHPTHTFSLLIEWLPKHVSPERRYLETQRGSLVSYGLTVKLLKEVLPFDEPLNPVTLRNHLLKVAERTALDKRGLSACLGPAAHPRWAAHRVGLDGGYVRTPHKQGGFEVIAGKSVREFKRDDSSEERSSKCFALLQTYDEKPRRRLFERLRSQGMREN